MVVVLVGRFGVDVGLFLGRLVVVLGLAGDDANLLDFGPAVARCRCPRQQTSRLHRRGFTLVELLIVVVVIAILAAITVVAYRGVASNAQPAALKADLAQAASGLETYKIDNSLTRQTKPRSPACSGSIHRRL